MNNVIEAYDQTFAKEVIENTGIVLVDFYATWCGPCMMMAPVLERLADELAGRVKFVKVDVDGAPQLVARFGISSIPSLMVFNGDRVLDTVVGAIAPAALKARLEKALVSCAVA